MVRFGTDAKALALADLRRAVEGLRPHLTTMDQQAALFQIEEATDRLSGEDQAGLSGLMEFDATRLTHLLDITGPDLAVELLARLAEDLTNTRAALAEGTATADWKRLREGSHILISLAGSVGALSLQAMAESLNAAAHRQDRETLSALMAPLDGELGSLIQFVRSTRPPNGKFR